ncbi:MAG: TIGR03747 family integrating conjugative element membrane protein [Steroidobacteraceae bacterium]
MASTSTASAPQQAAPQPLHWRIVLSPLALIGMLFGTLISAVLVEWFGMALGVWTLPGAEHARQTLVEDIQYLNADFTQSLLGFSPVQLAAMAGQAASEWVALQVERLQIPALYHQLSAQVGALFTSLSPTTPFASAGDGGFNGMEAMVSPELAWQTFLEYFDAALYSVQTVVVRIVVALLTLPAYVLIGLACLLDGVVARDLRKFTAANESAFAYHRYRPWAKRFFVVGWYLYIAWPSSIHPNLVFIPSALLCGWAIFNTGKWFKKFF